MKPEDIIFNIIDCNSECTQYRFQDSNEVEGFTMFRYGNEWVKEFRNSPVLNVEDHGDGVIVDLGNKKKVNLDYSELLEVYLAIDYYFKNSAIPHNPEYEIQKFKRIE